MSFQYENDKNYFCAELESLIRAAVASDVSCEEVDQCLREVFHLKSVETGTNRRNFVSAVCARIANFLVWCSVLYILLRALYRYGPIESFVDRLYDEYTYTAMRAARFLALPILSRFPAISQYHNMKCLVPNPLYSPMDASDCWPCEKLKALVDLTGHADVATEYVWSLTPFVMRDAVNLKATRGTLYEILRQYEELFNDSTSKFQSTLEEIQEPRHLVGEPRQRLLEDKSFHITWQVSSSLAARVLRKTFRRPAFVPNNTEVALQRCFLIDGSQAPSYLLPETDFTNSWLMQVEGSRMVVVEPSALCAGRCGAVSILVKPMHVCKYLRQTTCIVSGLRCEMVFGIEQCFGRKYSFQRYERPIRRCSPRQLGWIHFRQVRSAWNEEIKKLCSILF
ncbi:unnamed protein product [Ixodes persulcatus]